MCVAAREAHELANKLRSGKEADRTGVTVPGVSLHAGKQSTCRHPPPQACTPLFACSVVKSTDREADLQFHACKDPELQRWCLDAHGPIGVVISWGVCPYGTCFITNAKKGSRSRHTPAAEGLWTPTATPWRVAAVSVRVHASTKAGPQSGASSHAAARGWAAQRTASCDATRFGSWTGMSVRSSRCARGVWAEEGQLGSTDRAKSCTSDTDS